MYQRLTWKLLTYYSGKVTGTKQTPWPDFDVTMKIFREKHREVLRFNFYNLSTWRGNFKPPIQCANTKYKLLTINMFVFYKYTHTYTA